MAHLSHPSAVVSVLAQHPLAKDDLKLKVVVVEDVPMMREYITELLVETGNVGIIGWADNARAAAETIREAQPHVVVLDITIPGTPELRNGIDVLRWVRRTYPNAFVIMLTNQSEPIYRQECLRAGAFAFLDKSSEFDQLATVIERIRQSLAGRCSLAWVN